MSDYSVELYREEGSQSRSVVLSVGPDGAVKLDTYDTGEVVERTWGHEDYEWWVDVPSSQVRKLLFALLRDRYSGRSDAVDEFAAFCKKEGIDYEDE